MKNVINRIGSSMALTLFIAAAVLTFACSEPGVTTTETMMSEPLVKDASFKSKKGGVPAGLIPNSQRYADNSMPAASGRDGEVTITARALIDVEGTTDLEITTGSLDSDDHAPGTITKVQVKALDVETPDNEEPVWVKNYNKLRDGGNLTTSYTGLTRGQQLMLHTNVKGIIRGTAVVFLTEYIKNRPDIQVTGVSTDEEAFVNQEVVITASIAESNADLGATTSCVLYIDGEEIDRANNVWVNAGDVVGCQFTTTFSEVGEKNIIVAAEDVTPGDFDNSNNSAYTSINIIEEPTGSFGENSFTWSGGVFMSSEYYYETRNGPIFDTNEYKSYLVYFNGYKQYVTTPTIPESIPTLVTSGSSEFEMDISLESNPWNSNCKSSSNNIVYLSVCTYGTQLNFGFNFYTYKQIYYGYNEFEGDYYRTTGSGPEFSVEDEISFALLIGDHTATGSFSINRNTYESRTDYGPENYTYYRSSSISGNGYGSSE